MRIGPTQGEHVDTTGPPKLQKAGRVMEKKGVRSMEKSVRPWGPYYGAIVAGKPASWGVELVF